MEHRWQEIQSIWQSNQFLYVLAGFLVGILFFPAIETLSTDASDLLSGFVPEAVGIGFTVLLIDRSNRRREKASKEQAAKERLIRQIRSTDNGIALQAVEELWAKGWLQDGTLRGITMSRSNLQNADLRGADLQNVKMSGRRGGVNLSGAGLKGAKLKGAKMELVQFSPETSLPDGSNWTPETDMTRFTDPNHPDFWEPKWAKEARDNNDN